MPGEAAHGAKSTPPLRTLADKVNWLFRLRIPPAAVPTATPRSRP
jgi:hypothetical protein